MEASEIDKLEEELQNKFSRIKERTKVLNLFRILSYGGSILYFLGVFIGTNILAYTYSEWFSQIDNMTILYMIIPLFVLITIGSAGTSYYYSKYIRTEQEALQSIIKVIFPTATYSLDKGKFSISRLMLSGLFGNVERDKITAYSLGALQTIQNNQRIVINDISITNSRWVYWLSKSSIGVFLIVIIYMIRGIFAKRIQDITTDFRGMFSTVPLNKNIEGIVIIVPDRLEKQIDYLAENIQKLKNRNGINLVKMENVDFEYEFSVYASDDILARYILTPARMRKIVELKNKYGRDIMLSYAFNQFYAAVNLPEGLLGLDNKKIIDGNSVHSFYNNVCMSQTIMSELSNV